MKRSERTWVQNQLREAVQANLRFWSAQPQSALLNEGDNVLAAVRYGLQLPSTRTPAARLLVQSFQLAQRHAAAWRPRYQSALADSHLPLRLRSTLQYQLGVLHWLAGESALAASQFRRGLRFAQQHSLGSLVLRHHMGLCLCALMQPQASPPSASALRQALPGVRNPALQAQAWAMLGSLAFLQKDYARAAADLEAALHASPASLARGQLHILRGLCAQAQRQPQAALKQYNAAAQLLPRYHAPARLMARLELLRATAHYYQTSRGQQVRLQPAVAALLRAADWLSQAELPASARAEWEGWLGRVYTRRGEVAAGIRYLSSAVRLSEGAGDQRLAADALAALQQLENKNPA